MGVKNRGADNRVKNLLLTQPRFVGLMLGFLRSKSLVPTEGALAQSRLESS